VLDLVEASRHDQTGIEEQGPMNDTSKPEGFQPIRFAKMSGSGNDFIVIDNRAGIVPPAQIVPLTRLVCRRRLSIGADGVVLIEAALPGDDAHFRWRYFNADGSIGELCGNGAMCGARFAVLHGIAPSACRFHTPSGIVEAVVDPTSSRVQIAVADTGTVQRDIAVNAANRQLCLHAVNTGVPHAVFVVENADAVEDFVEVGRAVRFDPVFGSPGTNVNVISVRDGQTLRMRTYERGVEGETLACGTGAVACAVIGTALGVVRPPVRVITSSGRPLEVDFAWDGVGARAANVTLSGEARLIAEGDILPDALG
jgi:diaminopimelate epimerase